MSATNVYVSIKRIPFGNAPPKEWVEETNIQATPDDFWLTGGYYGIDAVFATAGTVTLTKRGPNGSTYITVGTSTTFSSSPGTAVVLLGPGYYRLAIA
jgi:hypothetical protein